METTKKQNGCTCDPRSCGCGNGVCACNPCTCAVCTCLAVKKNFNA